MAFARPLVFGNWKMNGLRSDGLALASAVAAGARSARGTLAVFPPATILGEVAGRIAGSGVLAGGQDCHERPSGAFTGSLSAGMLKDVGAAAVLAGHSERRHGLGETDAMVRAKAEAALAAGLIVVVCIGETEQEWLDGKTLSRLEEQLAGSLPREATAETVVVAYEPVWAIGTGRTAAPADIARVHAHLRRLLVARLPDGAALRLLYGGSVKASNAAEIMAQPDVDGVLVGGASLVADEFLAISRAGAGA
ncbi:MAG: triose-phosphate isomerase [Geminicoccaceae bacterium]